MTNGNVHVHTVEAPVSGHARKAEKSVHNWNVYRVYELGFKQGFVEAAVSRAVCLQECPLREL